MNDNIKLFWYAGLFEGEGCIYIRRKKNGKNISYILEVQLTMTDKEIVKSFKNEFGGKTRLQTNKINSNAKDTLVWSLSGPHTILFLERLMPYLFSTSEKEKFYLGIEFQKQKIKGKPKKEYTDKQFEYYIKMKNLNRRGFNG